MKNYQISVTLPLTLLIETQASSREEAIRKAREEALAAPDNQWNDDMSKAQYDIMSETVRYKILQIPHGKDNGGFLFADWDKVKKDFDLSRYKTVYEGELETRPDERPDSPRILEEIFARFNLDLPDGYQGRSLSVSDVVCFPDIGTAYYCDNFGWKEIPLKQ